MKMSIKTVEYCPLCGEPIQENSDACTKCDWVRGYLHPMKFRATPRSLVAVALSIVPGLGQIFKGHKELGFALMLLGVPLALSVAFALNIYLGWAVLPIYWIAVAFDAFIRRDLVFPLSTPAARNSTRA
jgi:hypothetical protein